MLELRPSHGAPAAWQALRPLAFPRLSRAAGKALKSLYALTGRHRYDDFRVERVGGVPLLVTPSVFNPKIPRSGAYLAECLQAHPLTPGALVLDLGTGSGVGAIFAARRAQHVLAVDLNVAAVRCARINAQLNELEHRIEVRQGDLFAPVAAERFDLVLFNPPFLPGRPHDERDRAWRSADVPERFAEGLRHHLKPRGLALVVLSTFGGAQAFLQSFERHGLQVAVVAERRFINERLVVLKLSPAMVGTEA